MAQLFRLLLLLLSFFVAQASAQLLTLPKKSIINKTIDLGADSMLPIQILQTNTTETTTNSTNSTNGTAVNTTDEGPSFNFTYDKIEPQKVPCFEGYEDCTKLGHLLEYENYQFLNRSMGTIFSFYWGLVTVFFFATFYPYGDEELIVLMKTKHALYMYSWYWFLISHILIYFPFSIFWFQLIIFEWTDKNIANYTFWVNTIIFSFGPPVSVSILFLMLLVILTNWKNQDDFYSSLEPIMVELIYGFYATAGTYLLYRYKDQAILYYNQEKQEAYFEQVAEIKR